MRLETTDPIDNGLRRDPVIVMQRPALPCTCGQNTRVVGTTNNNRCACAFACRQQRVQRVLLKKGVTTREQDHVQVRVPHGLETNRSLVDADPKCQDLSRTSQLFQCTKAAAICQLTKSHFMTFAVGWATDVVDIQYGDMCQAEPLPACLP